jgi:hypothetical protein
MGGAEESSEKSLSMVQKKKKESLSHVGLYIHNYRLNS